MRQLTFDEAQAVSGADCGDLTMSVSITGVSVSGSLSDWGSCFSYLGDLASNAYYSFDAYLSTGIPYGEAHVG